MAKILVVDDEFGSCAVLKIRLEKEGHQVEAVASAKSAIRILDKFCPELVITDFVMPEMRGDQLAAIIKQNNPQMPVILMTSALAPEPCLADRVMSKDFPFDFKALKLLIQELLSR